MLDVAHDADRWDDVYFEIKYSRYCHKLYIYFSFRKKLLT